MIDYLQHEESRSTGVAGPSLAADRSKNDSDLEGCKQDIRGDITDAGLSEIEQLVKGKTFSRYIVIVSVVCFP